MKNSKMHLPNLFDTHQIYRSEKVESISNKGNFKEGFYFYLNLSHVNPHRADILGIALCRNKEQGYYVPLKHKDCENIKEALLTLKDVFEDENIIKISHDCKRQMIALMKHGITIKGFLKDIMIASYLLEPNKSNHHQIEAITLTHLHKSITFNQETDTVREHAKKNCSIVTLIKELDDIVFNKLAEERLYKVYH
ncbi:MAG: hypothetical protein N2738_01430, partial [Thermodesulfovibrionales bacterium]|nr:hypothetical protein [Thermodesulfovibrionales bacterium]